MKVYEEIRKKIGNVRQKNVVNVVFRGKCITLNIYIKKKHWKLAMYASKDGGKEKPN